jgi:predicted amidophosphoribosyltransferase
LGNLLQFGEDSRLKGYGGRVTHAILPLERTYCANCGRPWGWASEDSSEHIAAAEIVVFCEDCFEALNSRAVMSGHCARAPFERISETELHSLGLVEENLR